MLENISEKTITKRKACKCFGCLKLIQPKEKAKAETNVCDGEIYTLYFCMKCVAHISEKCTKCKNICYEYNYGEGGIEQGAIKNCKEFGGN